ncbi:uncharacterized protein VICG_01557 [Vittaforma corneae ATCC 50505]|uniref:CHY-type domain-containing protein n=1 Tax=Vittaforma corneae (strain ATCC 50505) TaxID=993615 RepID=L2GMC6_VITCO|nr:uncharacterized protein VICG_01557 [Vittaforma corneae ATCC 50505]ELA41452.1 hypothetical protein VICG_01557 [Vittaforma corneae ATCC 50505]
MDSQVSELFKTHKVERGKVDSRRECYNIYVHKPCDFVYDTSDIVVRYFPENGSKTVICKEIPQSIKENISKFNILEIKDFIEFFEDNLNVFFMGKVPEFKRTGETTESLGEGELPKDFKFPVSNNVTPNLKCDISITNILLICCLQLNMVVKCSKCQEVSNITFNKPCKRCSQEIGFIYVPTVSSDSLGFLQLKKCEFVCFNSIRYQFNCQECQKNYESDEVNVGGVFSRKCNGCYNELRFKVNRIDFYQKKDVKIKEGEELPGKGACKHYKKSYRWFRFSCCNSLYPCDVCHDEQSGHKAEMAFRMVCGLCSKEQSVKQECDCGMNLKRKHAQFWEGGKGNRDRITMSRKDSKKYKG